MHPAVAETMSRYAEVWDENDKLRDENVQLVKDNEVLQRLDQEKSTLIIDLRRTLEETQRTSDDRLHKAEVHFRERLAEAERAKERYLRYAVSISERIQGCISDLEAAHSTSMEMAHQDPKEIEDEISSAVKAMQENKPL
jgi:predicted translin family RNA/ssDNA-binding protein